MAEALNEFTKIPHITERKAVALYDAGYKTVTALEQATRDEIAAVDGLEAGDAKRIREHFEAGGAGEPGLCPVCGTEVKERARKCERCGEPIAGVAAPCPECGQPVLPDAEACPSCGRRFVEAPAPPPPVVEVPEAPAPVIEAPLPEVPIGVPGNCPFCDAPVPPDAISCPSCGTNLRAARAAVAAPAPRTVIRERRAEPVPLPELKGSSTYLVKEETPLNSYRLFLSTMGAGRKGFCVTRVYPEKVREQYGLVDVPILWLSNVGKEDTVRPKDLEKLSLSLEQFIAHEGGVVLIDGIEYLITNNNFITVLRLVQALRDQVAINNAILLFTVNPATLDEHQLHLLEREVDGVLDLRG